MFSRSRLAPSARDIWLPRNQHTELCGHVTDNHSRRELWSQELLLVCQSKTASTAVPSAQRPLYVFVRRRFVFDVRRAPEHSNHVNCVDKIRLKIGARLPLQHPIRKEITCNRVVVVISSADVLANDVTNAGGQRPGDAEACSATTERRNISSTLGAKSASLSYTHFEA